MIKNRFLLAAIFSFLTLNLSAQLVTPKYEKVLETKEETVYAEAIMRDIKWLGFDWQDRS